MPGTTRVEIRTLKVGRYVALEENAYKILGMSKSKPGKHGSAKARIELEDIFTVRREVASELLLTPFTSPLSRKALLS